MKENLIEREFIKFFGDSDLAGRIYAGDCKAFARKVLEQSPEPVKNTGRHPVSTEPGVDELISHINFLHHSWIKNCMAMRKEEKQIYIDRSNRIIQLLTHISTSGNNMSDKRTVTLCEIHEFCHNLLDEFEIDREDLIEIEAELAQWLKELGIEVK